MEQKERASQASATRPSKPTSYPSHPRPAQPIAPMENIKEMQQKLKEEKEAKRAHLDGRHDYILSIVSACVNLEKNEVEDAVLEGNQIERIDQFFSAGGFRHVMFYYQDMEGPEIGHESSTGTNPVSAKGKKTKLFVTEGDDVALTGICVFFIRTNPSKAINADNIHRVSFFYMYLWSLDYKKL
ncbi:PREDICTED: dynein heavy chain 5, axonemal-like [Thamnophis sirtalis]|uniref:Dynein heavy chain 5, axonemal-like n=1 Tax=Thamnophis sirtalis TaxID=35019 RepID=A0A6I9YW14_9SAUR|nr:PREDICTED: dynein heavy chain 5, axonemal-like [Thamnophis sirtalis]